MLFKELTWEKVESLLKSGACITFYPNKVMYRDKACFNCRLLGRKYLRGDFDELGLSINQLSVVYPCSRVFGESIRETMMKKMLLDKSLNYYMGLNYDILITHKPECCGFYYLEHPDLRGCMTDGDTIEEALVNLADAKELWITTQLEDGLKVPEPKTERWCDVSPEV